jgi:hypothetical protein
MKARPGRRCFAALTLMVQEAMPNHIHLLVHVCSWILARLRPGTMVGPSHGRRGLTIAPYTGPEKARWRKPMDRQTRSWGAMLVRLALEAWAWPT